MAAFLAEAEFISNSISMIYLLNRRYKPFYKWMHRGLKELPILGEQSYQLLQQLVNTGNGDGTVYIEELCMLIIEEMRRVGLSNSASDFLLDHGPEVQIQILDANLRKIDPWVE